MEFAAYMRSHKGGYFNGFSVTPRRSIPFSFFMLGTMDCPCSMKTKAKDFPPKQYQRWPTLCSLFGDKDPP